MHEGACVYVVWAKDTPYYKIGATKNIINRLANLQAHSPVPLSLVVLYDCCEHLRFEGKLHREFADKQHHGEWFTLSAEDIEFLLSDAEYLAEWYLGGNPVVTKKARRSLECPIKPEATRDLSREIEALRKSWKMVDCRTQEVGGA